MVTIRGGGDTVNGVHVPGTNPGTVQLGTIDVSSAEHAGHGQIFIDNFGGAVITGPLICNGDKLQVRSSALVQITGDPEGPAILNSGFTPRAGMFWQADTIIDAPEVLISGGSIQANDSALFIGSIVQLGTATVAVNEISAKDTFGTGVFAYTYS